MNPVFRNDTYSGGAVGEVMSVRGAVNKTFVLLGLVIFGAAIVWGQPLKYMSLAMPAMIAGAIIALVTIFKKEWSPVTAPCYAFCEGIVIGWLSSMVEQSYPGIAAQAVILTFGVLFCMLGLYQSGIIKLNDKLRMCIFAATGAIGLVYLVSFIMGFFGKTIPLIHGSGPIGIGFSLIVIGVASFNLIIDFDFIEKGPQYGAPKYMEWYGAFGLMVTLIWVYIEILRLLAKLRRD